MAKLNGPLGSKLRGKVGEVVAAKTVGGVTAIRAYQPVVKNPNTLRQQASRNRFKFVSGICATLAPVIDLGYAKAASGAKMYPRNMALRDMIGDNALIIQSSADEITIDPALLPLSKKDGIIGTPSVTYTAPTQSTEGQIVCTNGDSIVLPSADSKLGVVYAVVLMLEDGTGRVLAVKQSLASSSVAVTAAEAAMWSSAKLYAFFKAVPETGNIINTNEVPWKYPSETGETVLVRTFE